MHYDANRRVLYIFDEKTGNKLTNEQWAERIEVYKNELITADSAEMKSIGDFKSYGFMMSPAVKGPGSVDYSMKWLAGLKEIVIDPIRCPLAAKEFINYEYEKTKDGDVISSYPDKDNHSIDAVRYALERVWRRAGN